MRRALVLLVAGVWLALAGIALSGTAVRVSAAPFVTPSDTPSATPTTPTEAPTATPTNTPHPGGSPTPSVSPSVTATGTATGTPTTAPPTATSGDTGGGGGGGNGGDVGPQPTKVVSQLPSAGGNGSGPLGGLSPGAFGSNGLLLAATSSCIVALLGLLIAAIALSVLLRGGYGPFLKALLRGKRAGQAHGKPGRKGDLATANANTSSNRYGFGPQRDDLGDGGGGLWDDQPRGRGEDARRQGSPSRSRSRGASRGGW